jgi:hypothetical protein
MEIVAEIISALVQFLLEVALQIAADLFAELGIKGLREVVKPSRPPKVALAAIGYLLMGATAGCLSLWRFPTRFAGSPGLRLMTLALAPLASALIIWAFFTLIGRPAKREERRRRFWYAYAFGLAFALVRFTFGH